jgi:hypothetical protein
LKSDRRPPARPPARQLCPISLSLAAAAADVLGKINLLMVQAAAAAFVL